MSEWVIPVTASIVVIGLLALSLVIAVTWHKNRRKKNQSRNQSTGNNTPGAGDDNYSYADENLTQPTDLPTRQPQDLESIYMQPIGRNAHNYVNQAAPPT